MVEVNYGKYFPIVEYYKRFVIPINSNRYKIKADKMMVCPLHDDHDPSLGIVKLKNKELFHCFGCNSWGDVVELHMRVSRRLLKRYLSEEESIRDLCRIFNIDYDTLPKPVAEADLDSGVRQELALSRAMERFDILDFKNMILEGKRSKKGIPYFNTVMMIMVNEIKSSEE